MSKAVIEGKIVHVSPSQVNTFKDCKRKWRLEKVEGLRVKPTDSQATGENRHSEMQVYYETGTPPTNQSCLLLTQHPDVPRPSPELLVEHPRDYRLGIELAGVPVHGRADLLDPRPAEADFTVWDWKTTKDFKYRKSSEDLARNTQLVIYAHARYQADPAAQSSTHAHGYILTTGNGAHVVKSDPVSRSDVENIVTSIEDTVEQMKAAAIAPSWEDVEPNYNHCEEYRGCPYRYKCLPNLYPHPPEELITATMSTITLEEKLNARRVLAQGINPPDAAPNATMTPHTTVAVAASDLEGLARREATTSGTHAPSPGATDATLVLYVDCLPSDVQVTRLEDLIAERSKPIAEMFKVADIREVKFGEATARLFASFLREPPVGSVALTNTGLSAQVLEVLLPKATRVVRATR